MHFSVFANDAALFNVVATGTPAQVSISLCLNAKGMLSCEKQTVSALSLSITPTVPNHTYPEAGIYVNTPGYTIGSLGLDCVMLDNGYCVFSVSSSAPKSITLTSSTKSPRFAYIGNFSDSVMTQCPVNSDGTLGTCVDLTGPDNMDTNLFNQPLDVAFNAAGTLAYIANYCGGNILRCMVDPALGTFSDCLMVADILGDFSVRPESVNLNNSGTLAYIGNHADTTPMVICSIDAVTGLFNACNGTSQLFDYATNVIFNSAGTSAYVGQWHDAYIYLCEVDIGSGTFNSCIPTPVSANLGGPAGIAFNPSKNMVYITAADFTGTFPPSPIHKCTVNLDQSLTCSDTSDNLAAFNMPTGIEINAAGTFAYISNYGTNMISYCAINGSGDLINCQNTGSTATTSLFGMTLLY